MTQEKTTMKRMTDSNLMLKLLTPDVRQTYLDGLLVQYLVRQMIETLRHRIETC